MLRAAIIFSKVIGKPTPLYPKVTIATPTQGTVKVEILIDRGEA